MLKQGLLSNQKNTTPMVYENQIFEDNNKYESKIYPYSVLQLLKTQKRFNLLFNQGNILTKVTGTNALIPIINIFLEKYSPRHDYNRIYCCLGTQLFHSFVVIIESLHVPISEIEESILFILDKQNAFNLPNMAYLLSLFLIYLKLLYKHSPDKFLEFLAKTESDSNTLSILDYGKLEFNSVPLSYNIKDLKDGIFDEVEVISLFEIISTSSLWNL